MEQAEVTARAKAQKWGPTKQSQGGVRGPLGLESGEEAGAQPICRPQSGGEQGSPEEICALRGRGQVWEVPPQHILFCVTWEIINWDPNSCHHHPSGILALPVCHLGHTPAAHSVGEGTLINPFFRCAGPGHPHTSPFAEKVSARSLGSQEPGLMGAFPTGQEPANSLPLKVLWALKDPNSADNGIRGNR